MAKYIAVSTREAALDVASMARTSTKVFVLEVMGRHAGWIAAAGGLAGERPAMRRTSSCFRKSPFDAAEIPRAREGSASSDYGYCVIVVSEGAAYADGKFLAEAGTTDAFGHTQLGGVGAGRRATWCSEALGYKYHWAVADYLQRAARHIASQVDVEQAYAVGKAAVEFALKGKNAVMPTIVRKSSQALSLDDRRRRRSRRSPTRRRSCRATSSRADGFGITAACRRYLAPLIAGEDYPPYRDGLPDYVALKGVGVRRKLKTEFKV